MVLRRGETSTIALVFFCWLSAPWKALNANDLTPNPCRAPQVCNAPIVDLWERFETSASLAEIKTFPLTLGGSCMWRDGKSVTSNRSPDSETQRNLGAEFKAVALIEKRNGRLNYSGKFFSASPQIGDISGLSGNRGFIEELLGFIDDSSRRRFRLERRGISYFADLNPKERRPIWHYYLRYDSRTESVMMLVYWGTNRPFLCQLEVVDLEQDEPKA